MSFIIVNKFKIASLHYQHLHKVIPRLFAKISSGPPDFSNAIHGFLYEPASSSVNPKGSSCGRNIKVNSVVKKMSVTTKGY